MTLRGFSCFSTKQFWYLAKSRGRAFCVEVILCMIFVVPKPVEGVAGALLASFSLSGFGTVFVAGLEMTFGSEDFARASFQGLF